MTYYGKALLTIGSVVPSAMFRVPVWILEGGRRAILSLRYEYCKPQQYYWIKKQGS